jgi:hypothetical protein
MDLAEVGELNVRHPDIGDGSVTGLPRAGTRPAEVGLWR